MSIPTANPVVGHKVAAMTIATRHLRRIAATGHKQPTNHVRVGGSIFRKAAAAAVADPPD